MATGLDEIEAAAEAGALLPPRRWHVLEARGGCDLGVWRRLAKDGYEVWRPVDAVTVTRRVKVGGVWKPQKQLRKIPRFGRYLFLRACLGPCVRAAIMADPEVVGFLMGAGGTAPAVVPDALIAFYRESPEAGPAEQAPFSAGDKVRIAHGPATGVVGVVREALRAGAMIAIAESSGAEWSGRLLVPYPHLELVEAGKGVVVRGTRSQRRGMARAQAEHAAAGG